MVVPKKRQRQLMQPSKQMRSPAPESQRQTAIRSFRSAVRACDGRTKRVQLDVCYGDVDGLFSIISDDAVALILKIALIPSKGVSGIEYFDDVNIGARAVLGMALVCKRFTVLLHELCPELQIEAIARSCTRVLPEARCSTFAFTRQMRSELLSCDSLKMLKAAHGAMALHCAKECCRNAHRAFNKDVRKGLVFSRPSSPTMSTCAPEENQLVSISDNCSIQDANKDGNVTFMYMRERLSKIAVHGEERARRFRDVIVRHELDYVSKKDSQKPKFKQTNTLEVDSGVMSPPLTIRTSPCGNFTVFTRALHEVDPEVSLPFSAGFLWHKTWKKAVELSPARGWNLGSDVLSAQDAWFRTNDRGEIMLVVAWSTEFYHSSGHFVGSNVLDQRNARFLFSSYYLDSSMPEHPEHDETTFAEGGSLLACKPFKDGNKVLTLSKKRDIVNGFRCVYSHDLAMSSSFAVTSTCVDAGPKGPVAAGVSPSGDCVVVVCKNQKSVRANVCWQTGERNFTPVANLDITPWLGLYSNDANFGGDLVKASVDIQFSPCSRFFAVVDRHPLFGAKPEGHGAVIIDTAMRGVTNKLRPFPLFSLEDQCPRSFQWTRRGIFLLPPGTDENGAIGARGGSVCLLCPTATGFM